MKLLDYLDIDFFYENEKGRLLQLVHEGYSQINVVTSYKGSERGGHFHEETKEAFFIIDGTVELTLSYLERKEEYTFHKNDFFVIYPNVVHEMFFPEDCIMIALYTKAVERADGTKDIHLAD